MKDTGLANVILEIKISRTSDGIFLTQAHYIENVLGKIDIFDVPPANNHVDMSLHLVKNKGDLVSQSRLLKQATFHG
ncbi:hypothetical protein ACS0TY_004219 [Phlomoides rotata]